MAQFDTAKGAFYLVAIIICTQMLFALVIVAGCVGGRLEGAIGPGTCKGVMDQMLDLFQMSFTAAIAFAGGRMSAPVPPSPKLPEERDDDDPDH